MKNPRENLRSMACLGNMAHFMSGNMELPEWLSGMLKNYANSVVKMLTDVSEGKMLQPENRNYLMSNLMVYLGYLVILLKKRKLVKFEPGFVEAVHQDMFQNIDYKKKNATKILNETIEKVYEALEMSMRDIHNAFACFDFPAIQITITTGKNFVPCILTTEDEIKYGKKADEYFEKIFGNFLKTGKMQ